jgi:ABC-type bacteriocin/lantibiotic exporter with double-glycine peptidase domain
MLKAVRASLAFMTREERVKWQLLTGLRGLLSILDLVGILAIGFVASSTAIFLTQGSSPNRVLIFAGFEIPAVTAQTLPVVASAILATFLLKAILSIRVTKAAAYFVATVEARAAKAIATKVFGGDLTQARLRSREEMSFAIQSGSPAAFNVLLNAASTVIAEGSLFLIICLGFLLVDPIATIVAIAYFASIAILIQYFVGTLMARAGAMSTEATIEANGAVGDLIAVFRELSVLGVKDKFIDRIYKSRVTAADSAATQTYLNGMPRYIIEAGLLVGVALFILAQSLTGDIVESAATIGVFLSGGFRLTAAMLPLQATLLVIKGAIPTARTAQEILVLGNSSTLIEADRSFAKDNIYKAKEVLPVMVHLKDVNFQYAGADTPTLFNLSLAIQPGEQVALIGASGAGKSTIADLMCGVLTPSTGEVVLSNASFSSGSKSRPSVSYLPQKPGLVAGTVAQNIAIGVEPEQVDEGLLREVIERAHLGSVISALPEGVQTRMGNYQDGLSGGQIQRLGLARALYTKPGLLIMDEATSALDAESESEIAKALEGMRGKVTVVLIAHRLNSVQHADRVFLIAEGKVADSGTFQELLKRNPSIDRLVQLMKVDEG